MPGGERTTVADPEFAILDRTPADGGQFDDSELHEHHYIVAQPQGGHTVEVGITPLAAEIEEQTFSRIRVQGLGRLPVRMERYVTPPLMDEEHRQEVAVRMAAEALRFASLDVDSMAA